MNFTAIPSALVAKQDIRSYWFTTVHYIDMLQGFDINDRIMFLFNCTDNFVRLTCKSADPGRDKETGHATVPTTTDILPRPLLI